MTTDLNALRVETRMLAKYAQERQEDAYVCHAIRLFTDEVGAIPDQAFGTIEGHSDRYRRDWARVFAARQVEEVTARDELWNISNGLLQVAADYENTDIELSYDFDVQETGIGPYLNKMGPPAQTNPHRPGDPIGGQAFPSWAPFGARAGELPGQDEFNRTQNEPLPSVRALPSTTKWQMDWLKPERYSVEVPHTEVNPGLEHDMLSDFMAQHAPILQQLEQFVSDHGIKVRKPLDDVIIHAFRASPKIIRNRSLLLGRAANGLNEIRREMFAASENLKLYWNSPGGMGTIPAASGAFFIYSDTTLEYLNLVADSIEWWSEQGVQIATVLEGIRLAYANTGFNRINELYTARQKYNEATRDALSSCKEPEQALGKVVTRFADMIYDSAKLHIMTLQDLLKADDQRRREEMTLKIGSLVYGEPTPFPMGKTNTGAWSDSSGWSPKATAPTQASEIA